MREQYEKCLWRWFNKKAMQWLQVVKLKDAKIRPWLFVRGQGSPRERKIQFATLGDLIAALFEPELESLIEKLDVPAMELIAMAADDGEAA